MNLTEYGIIDLHLHLDGSLSPEWLIEEAKQQNIILPTSDPKALMGYISAPQDCTDLNDYLRSFALPLSLLQTPQALQSAMIHLLTKLDRQGVVYAEIRFAPQLHLAQGMIQEQAVQAAIEGLQQGLKSTQLFAAQLILCCMRGDHNQAENLETVKLAHQFLGKGVAAIDLAGAEGLFPTENFEDVFSLAKQLGVPFTLHAGEAAGAKSVKTALDFGASRIGHGIRARESESVMSQLIQQKTPLEMCPCSNLQTKTVKNLQDYPLRDYLQRGVVATINTDNMTVSNTSLHNEFRLLSQEYGLKQNEAKQLLLNAIQAAFLSAEDKQRLFETISARYPALFQ